MESRRLTETEVRAVTAYLGLPVQAPTLRYLNCLIAACIRRVPWESVSRIVKHRASASPAGCPRWPAEFWQQALCSGTGGTCFESSLAFYSLLLALGYQGYLTVNDMGESRACHAAITILLGGRKYLVDVTIPVHCAVAYSPEQISRRTPGWQTFTVRPQGAGRYLVERSHHPSRAAFTLIDAPVSLADFQAIVERDYTPAGFFLHNVVINRLIDGGVWRFFSDRSPLRIEHFNRREKSEIALSPESAARTLAERFGMPEWMIAAALAHVEFDGRKPLAG